MCTTVWTPEGDVIETVGALRERWPIVIAAGGGDAEVARQWDHTCLCPVDVEASAARNGARVRKDDMGDYEIIEEGKVFDGA